jgi:predicted transcriptional regulator
MSARKVSIATLDEMKSRTMAIARGDLKVSANDPKIWAVSREAA